MKYGIFSANEWLYPDSCPEQGKREISLLAPGSSFACVQILCRCSSALSVKWMPEKDGIAPKINRLLPFYVDKNTSNVDNPVTWPQGTQVDYVTRLAPFHVFDPMEPVEDPDHILPEDGVVALYLSFPTKDVPAGCYAGRLQLTCEGESADVPVSVTVAKVCVPEKETLRQTNWFSLKNMATYHNLSLWSDEHWDMIAEYGRMMRHAHQTDFILGRDTFFHTLTEEGRYIFDFTKTERLIRLYLSLGFQYFEGPHMLHRDGWDKVDFYVLINDEKVPAFSEEAQVYLHDFFTAWYDFLCRNGWEKIATQHVNDEPPAGATADYHRLAAQIHQWLPGIPTIDAVDGNGGTALATSLDIMVPLSNAFASNKEAFFKAREEGHVLWFYTACYPGGKYLNRFLDFELLRTRYLHWANHLYGIVGYLHWGLNQYEISSGGAFAGACDWPSGTYPSYPAGDTHIVYPKEDKVLSGARFEMMRAGCEDYELFQLAAKKDPEKAAAILSQCVRSMTDYTTDIAVFDNAYAQLLALAE